MLQLYLTYLKICALKAKVAEVDSSIKVIVLNCSLIGIAAWVFAQLRGYESTIHLQILTFAILIFLVLFVYIALRVIQKESRFRHTLSAILGTRIFFDFLALFVLVLELDEHILSPLSALLWIYRVIVVGAILRDSMDISFPAAILWSTVFTILAINVAALLVGQPIVPDPTGVTE